MASIAIPVGAANPADKTSPIHLSAVTAEFVQSEFATHYTVEATDILGQPKYNWHLQLQLIDKPGAPDPDTFGSGARVDLACDNAGFGITDARTSKTTEFIWHHPDAEDSTPVGLYHCNHQLQGPSGHQGAITVTATQGEWTCTAVYDGTKSGVGKPAHCVEHVATATKPTSTNPPKTPVTSARTPPTATTPPVEYKPKFSAEEKANFKFLKHVYTFGAIGLGILAALAAEIPPAAIGIGISAGAVGAGAEVWDIYADDPPDANYGSVAKPAPVIAPVVTAGKGLTSAAARAIKAFAKNALELKSLSHALITAINRGQGANVAKATAAAHRQELAASQYAKQSAALLSAEPSLLRAVLEALPNTSYSTTAVAAEALQIQKNGFPQAVAKALAEGGASSQEIASLASQAETVSGSLSVSSVIKQINSSSAARPPASQLKRFASTSSALAK